jgi:osmotically-inducible protein OsmY
LNKLKGTFAGKGPKGYVRSDARVLEDVCDRLMWHPEIDAGEIEVTVNAGEVTLSGTVEDRHTKRLAEDIVEDVAGVKDVSNRLRVGLTSAVTDVDTRTTKSTLATPQARPLR